MIKAVLITLSFCLFFTACGDDSGSDIPSSITSITMINTISNVSGGLSAVKDDLLFVTSTSGTPTNSLRIFNFADPLNPVLLGSYDTGGTWGIAVNGNHAYVETQGSGSGLFSGAVFGAIDISDPAAPAATLSTTGGHASAQDNYYHNGHIYSVSWSMIGIYNISNPDLPSYLTNIKTTGCEWLAIEGNYLYAVDGGWFKIWDITDPANPVSVGSNQQSGTLSSGGVAVYGNAAYATGTDGKMCIYDISSKQSPVLLNTMQLMQTNSCNLGEAKVLGKLLLITGADEFHALSISDPANPVQTANYPFSPGGGYGLTLYKNRYAIVANQNFYMIFQLW